MKNFILSSRIQLDRDQDLEEIKDFLNNNAAQIIDISEMSAGINHFHLKGSTGSLFDFIRRAKIYAEFDMIVDDTKASKDLRLIVKGHSTYTVSLTTFYMVLFIAILVAGLLPGSFETDWVNSNALDAIVFLLVGYYIKTDLDNALDEAEQAIKDTIKTLETRFGV
jgi:hypothetical protein